MKTTRNNCEHECVGLLIIDCFWLWDNVCKTELRMFLMMDLK